MRIKEDLINKEVLDGGAELIGKVVDVVMDKDNFEVTDLVIKKTGIADQIKAGGENVVPSELVKVIDESKYLAEIKNVSADEKYLGDDGEIDLSKFTPITYDPVHHGYYRLGERVGNAFKDGAKLK